MNKSSLESVMLVHTVKHNNNNNNNKYMLSMQSMCTTKLSTLQFSMKFDLYRPWG